VIQAAGDVAVHAVVHATVQGAVGRDTPPDGASVLCGGNWYIKYGI
jgi:hypothetical protein